MLGQRTTYTPKLRRHWLVVAFVGGLFILALSGVALFVITEKKADSSATAAPLQTSRVPPIGAIGASVDKDLNNDGRADDTTRLEEFMLPVRSELNDDLDNDGNPDGMADPLVGLGVGLLALPSIGGSLFLLSLYKLPMVGFDYYPTLGRPG